MNPGNNRYAEAEVLVLPATEDLVSIRDLLPASGNVVVATLDGRSMVDEDAVYYSFYDHLRFPEYFGWNWDALSDCLRDLSWYPASGYLIVIDNSECVMSDFERERLILFRILRRAAKEWANPMLRRQSEVSFLRVVMLCSAQHVQRLKSEVEAAGY